MDILTLVGLIIGLFIVVFIISAVFIFMDLMSYTGSSFKSLSPTGTATGRALVVYNPGISGMASKAAGEIATELIFNGYEVDLAGVRKAPASTSDYDLVMAGGPMYGGKLTRSMEVYLKKLKLQDEVKLGVFTTTGTDQFHEEDFQSLTKQVERLVDTSLSKPTIKLIRSKDKSTEDINTLVSETIE